MGAAHVAFFFMFAWRGASGGIGSSIRFIWAGLAAFGFIVNFIGWSLVKHGGRTRVRKWGTWAIALSTALGAFLLFVAS
jgi:hypothetical protein